MKNRPTFITIENGERPVKTVLTPPAEHVFRKSLVPARCRTFPTQIILNDHEKIQNIFMCDYCMAREVKSFGEFCGVCSSRDLNHWREKYSFRKRLAAAVALLAIVYARVKGSR